MNLCKDCRWAEDKSSKLITWWICHHRTSPQRALPDYILGRSSEPRLRDCTTMRDDPGLCGPDGRYWEQALEISGNVGFGEALAEEPEE
jgi:hypothetical protein